MRLTLLLCLLGSPTLAQSNCGPHDAFVAALGDKFNESQRMIALQMDGRVLEIFAADDGAWTALVTTPGGLSCMVASGLYYEATAQAMGVDG
ncbi:MAG: hypothetical protein ACPG4X_21230 [Pikeienuella sp.]